MRAPPPATCCALERPALVLYGIYGPPRSGSGPRSAGRATASCSRSW
ncbi:hypothetical protein WME98_37270 [Sorangium sp. So ce296]